MRRSAAILVLALVATSCDTTTDSVHRPEPVVEAYLEAGSELPHVRLTWTASIDGIYDPNADGITGADLSVSEIGPDGAPAWTVPYSRLSGQPGIYVPDEARVVRAGGTYRMDATLVDGTVIRAQTVVPDAFELVGRSADAVTYQGTEQFELEMTPSSYPGRDPIYIITIEALDPVPSRLTPFYLDIIYEIDPGDSFDPDTLDSSELADFVVVSSPPLNEANYRDEGEATVVARLPWFSVVFYGPSRIRVNAVDDNIYDFVRYQAVQTGGSTLSPGEIPNIREGIEGGAGLFGSYAGVEAVVNVLEP